MEQILHRCAFGCRSGQLGGIARMVTRRNDLQEALALWPNAFKPFHQHARTKPGGRREQTNPSIVFRMGETGLLRRITVSNLPMS